MKVAQKRVWTTLDQFYRTNKEKPNKKIKLHSISLIIETNKPHIFEQQLKHSFQRVSIIFITATIRKRSISIFTRDAVESILVANYITPNHSPQHLGSEAVAFQWTYADTSQIAKKKKKKKKKVSWKQKTNYYCLQVFNDIWTPLAPPRKYWFLFSWDRSLPIVISRIPTKLFWILIKFSDCLPNTFQQRRSLCG